MDFGKGLIAAVAVLTALLAPVASAQAAPCPDTRAAAQGLTANAAHFVCTSETAATPNTSGDPSLVASQARTVWFKWVAPAGFNGPVVVDLEGTVFDAVIGVFEGASNELRNGSNVVDMVDEYAAEYIHFSATAGKTYSFMVAAYSADEDEGEVRIRVSDRAPENDVLSGAREIPTDLTGRGGAGMNTRLASPTGEPGEPNHAGLAPIKTLWFKVTARKTGRMFASTCSSYNGDTVLAAYEGSTYGSGATRLVSLGGNDDNPIACGGDSRALASYVGWAAQAGQTYRVAVGLTAAEPEGALGPELVTVGYDDVSPTTAVKVGPPPATRDTAASFEWEYRDTDTSGYECAVDAGAFGGCTELLKHTVSGLADGDHTFRVRAVDVSGNLGAPAEHKWRVDTTPPDTRITVAPTGTITTGNFSVAFDAEPGASYSCSLDNAAAAPCTSPQNYLDVPDGNHTFSVRARDALGNEDPTPALAGFAIKRPVPLVTTSKVTLTGGANSRATTIAKLAVPGVLKGTKVVLRCSPRKRCPFKGKKTATAKRNGTVNLTRFVRRRPLRTGTVLELTITRRGTIGKIVSFRMRKNKPPKETIFCVPPGGKPGKC